MSKELVPRPDSLPDVVDNDGLGFVSLAARVTVLVTQALALKEGVGALQRHMADNATKAASMAEMCDAAEVDPYHTGLILDGSTALSRVADASGDLLDAADATHNDAQGFADAHEQEYRPGWEVTQASAYQQPKPGFNEVT